MVPTGQTVSRARATKHAHPTYQKIRAFQGTDLDRALCSRETQLERKTRREDVKVHEIQLHCMAIETSVGPRPDTL